MSSSVGDLIVQIEEDALDAAMAARALRGAALELLDEVNRLERAYPQIFLDLKGREWHIARYDEWPPDEGGDDIDPHPGAVS